MHDKTELNLVEWTIPDYIDDSLRQFNHKFNDLFDFLIPISYRKGKWIFYEYFFKIDKEKLQTLYIMIKTLIQSSMMKILPLLWKQSKDRQSVEFLKKTMSTLEKKLKYLENSTFSSQINQVKIITRSNIKSRYVLPWKINVFANSNYKHLQFQTHLKRFLPVSWTKTWRKNFSFNRTT